MCQPVEGCSHSSHSCTESSLRIKREKEGKGAGGLIDEPIWYLSNQCKAPKRRHMIFSMFPHFLFSVPFHNTMLTMIDKILEGNGMLVSQSSGKQRLSGQTNSSGKLGSRNM